MDSGLQNQHILGGFKHIHTDEIRKCQPVFLAHETAVVACFHCIVKTKLAIVPDRVGPARILTKLTVCPLTNCEKQLTLLWSKQMGQQQ
jgi:hypothetical protein